MKRIILLTALAGLLLAACGPQTYTKYMQVRQPSRAGIDLTKRTMSVVYLSDPDSLTETASSRQAIFLARNLENQYFDGEEKVALYRLDKDPAGDYTQRDTLIRMVVGTGDDVVFLVDTPEQGHQAAYNVYVLDSMSGSDEVKKFAGESRIGDEFAPDWVMVSLGQGDGLRRGGPLGRCHESVDGDSRGHPEQYPPRRRLLRHGHRQLAARRQGPCLQVARPRRRFLPA